MEKRNILKSIAFALVLMLPGSLMADGHAAAGEKPSISATQTVKVVTVVEAIDLEARKVTLKGPEGNLQTVDVEPDTHNLDMVEVGDQVNIEYIQNMSIEVFAPDGTQPGTGTMTAVARNKEDEAPGRMEVATAVSTSIVHEINLEANTFKLRTASGEIKEFVAQDPENLRKAAVGDLVVATYTEAVAVYLAEVPAE